MVSEYEHLRPKLHEGLSIGGLDTCWEWQRGRASKYASVWSGPLHRNIGVHRLAWELWRGPIPEGLTIDHLCKNTRCANPRHLEPVTMRVNVLRGDTIPARHAAKTHCPQGHEYSPENTWTDKKGKRNCRICTNARRRALRARAALRPSEEVSE